MILSYHNIIYYKTLFVKERLLNPFGHNDDFFGAFFFPEQKNPFSAPKTAKKEGVTPM
jgi:hypothetical protein